KALAEVDIENPVLTVKSIKGCGKDFLSNFMKTFWTTSDKKREIVRVIVSEGLVAVGIPLVKLKFSKTVRPRAKTVTGAMDPRLSRALVNIARLRRGGIFLDPFCGTGNLAIEACGIGANRAICLDLDKSMCEASRDNSERSGTDECVKVVRGDARVMPLPNNSIDAIATDPPYGRSSSTRGERYDSLIEKFLRESLRMLKSEAHIVYLGPYESKPWLIAEKAGLILLKRLHLFVHRSLIREVVIARVP
ncbi:MAG: RsmD family RNA methyltransferase, partial [Acidilobaceae archaeon]